MGCPLYLYNNSVILNNKNVNLNLVAMGLFASYEVLGYSSS